MTELNVISRGPADGPPLLLIHGAWHAAWCWEGNYLDFFAEAGFSTHALDLRGHGQSPPVRAMRWNRIRHYVDDAAQVIAALPSPPVLIGHSMGGFITQHLMRRGVAMRGAGLLCAVPHSGALPVALKTLRRSPRTFWRMISRASLWPMVEDPARAAHLFLDREAEPDEIAAFHARLSDESFMAFLDMTALALPRLPRKAPPVCVIGGELDQIVPPASQRDLADRFRTTATIIANGPHDLMLSRRWRASAQAFLDWISTLP